MQSIIYELRNSNPKRWTFPALDAEILDMSNDHGCTSFNMYKRERARVKSLDSVIAKLHDLDPKRWTFAELDRVILNITTCHGKPSWQAYNRAKVKK